MTDRARRLVLAAVSLGLAALFVCSLIYRMGDHPLVRQIDVPSAPSASSMAAEAQDASMPERGLVQQDPNNVDRMLGMAQLLAAQGDSEGALAMLERASVTAPADPRPPYLTGVQLAQAGRWEGAAQALERSLSLKDDARACYSLGVILRYHLQQEERAREQFEKAAALSDDPSLNALIETERKK